MDTGFVEVLTAGDELKLFWDINFNNLSVVGSIGDRVRRDLELTTIDTGIKSIVGCTFCFIIVFIFN